MKRNPHDEVYWTEKQQTEHKTHKTNTINEENIDEVIDRAIARYWEVGNLVDALFWSSAIRVLRDKFKKEEK